MATNNATSIPADGGRAGGNSGLVKFNRISAPSNFLFSALFVALALVCVIPLVFVAIISLSSDLSVQTVGYSFTPIEWTTNAYTYLFQSGDSITRAFFVSVGVTIVGTIIGLSLNASMGYVLSRPSFKLKKLYTTIIFIPMLFTGGMVASYMVNSQLLGLINSYWALILPISCSPFYIIILRTFFQTTVPDSIIESARIDGASQLFTFFRIVLPISKPALATIGLFLSFAYWNDWFLAMLYLKSDHQFMYPLQYVLIRIEQNIDFLVSNTQYFSATMSGGRIPAESSRMALVVIVVLPIACSYPFFQKYFISGLTIGAVKG
ncbi:MAG: carbohydrate ABC transporter permease [Clostridiales bacterium]|jgi:putative aldouronate transport system permease protein|nr:carbohydrate ABC transporter permease [Clostridiales bacterium]